jgi:carbonic anhydrase
MLKRGIDQTSAWILAVLGSGALFSGAYFGSKLLATRAAHGVETHGAPEDHGVGGHGETPADGAAPSGHESPAAPGEGHGEGGGDHGSAAPSTSAPTTAAAKAAHWDYRGSLGPDRWGGIDDAFKSCAVGKQQSPIDIDAVQTNAKLLPLRFHYKAVDAVVKNNGHTIQADLESGNYVEIDGERFDLLQFHFHTPSEHKVSSIPYDLELHLVHRNPEGRLAVIGVLFEEGALNKALAPVWGAMPNEAGASAEPVSVNPETLLPARRQYYSYTGSLTTPPCTEGVKWLVLAQPIELSKKQLEGFEFHFPINARPVQALQGRKVAKSTR